MEYEVTKWADLQKPDHLRLKSVSGQPTKEIEQPVDPPVDPVVDINTDEDIGSHPDSFPTDDLNNIEDIEGPLHEHYIEHHGPHPDWVDDNPGIPSSEKEDFPPVNKCCRPYQRNDTKFRLQQVMLPTCILLIAKYSFIWECILYLMNLLTFFLITFAAFFAFFEESLSATVIFIDAVFSCDVLVRLAVEIWRYRNQVSVVIFSVRYSMAQFLLDLISITPFHQLFFEFVGSENLQYLGYVDFCKFNRFLRLYRSYAFFTMLQEERKVDEKFMFLVRFTNMYIGFIHLVSCLLMYLVGMDPLDFLLFRNREMLNGTWMRVVNQKKYGYPTEKPYQMYVLSTNFAAATVTTVGYGDTSPGSETEMIWCIFFMLFGAVFLNGYFISQLTTFELETDGARFDLFFRVREILKYLKSVGTLPLFDEKVVEYYKCLWSYRGGVYEVQFFKCLPPAFQEDLLYDICQEMFDKSFLFNGMDEALLRAIAKIVKVALYNPEMILCRKGDYANKMYYILQGECRVMSKYMSKTAAILRAGSIIGEANLFFSYPYTSSVETRTCCQFLILEKEELIIAMDDFRDQIAILRSKSQTKVFKLYDTHQIFGLPPVCWVGAKTDYDNPSEPKPSSIRRIMRWGSGRNKEVIEDVINDTKDLVIFDTPCERKEVVKNHLTPYITCTVPQIMDSMYKWVPYWNGTIMVVCLAQSFVGPYCCSFGDNSEFEESMCYFLTSISYPINFLYMGDLMVEIISSAPVYGIYYQFWDGLKVRYREVVFYFDILAAIPICLMVSAKVRQEPSIIFETVFKCLKLWKVIRYLQFMDNRHPLHLFWFRLARTILVLLYGIHFIACITYVLACYDDPNGSGEVCHNDSWLMSYQKAYEFTEFKSAPRWMRMETLRDTGGYLYSIFYAAATLTSAGFGDFSPQTIVEMLWAIIFVLIGFFLIGYYTATLTSALSCVVRPKLLFQQKLMSVKQFMTDNSLCENLRDRIVEYFYLQNQLDGGVALARGINHVMYDTPEYLRNDVLYLEVVEILEGIPIFSKVESEVVVRISSLMNRAIIPPNTTFLQRGEIRRVMYLVKYGSMGIFSDESDEPMNILEASSHFGLRDLLFGEPCHFKVKTLSHCCLYSIKLHQLQEAMSHDEEFWDFVDHEKIRLATKIEEMVSIYSKLVKMNKKVTDVADRIPDWVVIPPPPKKSMITPYLTTKGPDAAKIKHAYRLNQEYDELFRTITFGNIFKLFLMRRTVHPVGTFARVWTSLMSVFAFLTFVLLCIETFTRFRRPGFRIVQWTLDTILVVDIYIKMHYCYYSTNKGSTFLISHPLKTCFNYVMHGTFIMDVLACIPLEMIIPLLGWTNNWGYGEGASWYTKLRWTRILHVKRIFVVFEITHTIFKHRNALLLILYVCTTIFVCTFLGAICLFTACPWESSFWVEGDEYRMPICLERRPNEVEIGNDYWATIKFGDAELVTSPLCKWILGVYYVSQVVLVIGFGDLITLRKTDVIMLILMTVFGFIFMRCVIADITAAEVDSDEIRATFVESVATLRLVMLRQNVPQRLMKSTFDHLMYTWERSKGLHPRELFADLHPSLESDVFKELVGNDLAKVRLFHEFTSNLMRTMSSYLRKVYFRRGERIMRCGNLENELRIITKGKVFICDNNYNYLCTLKSGDCFGESSMMFKARNRYNAVAMTNVEIYYLTSHSFQILMARYSNVKDILESRLRYGDRDYFEIGLEEKMKMTKMMTVEEKQELVMSFKVRRSMIKAALSLRENLKSNRYKLSWYHWSKFVDYGSLDENLPIVYFAKGRRKGGSNFAILIHPKCQLINFFNYLMIWMGYVTAAIATYETCFIRESGTDHHSLGPVSDAVIRFSYGIEILYLVHMLLKFITPFEVKNGVFCKSNGRIALSYLLDPSGFWLDCVACIPILIELGNQDLRTSDHKYIYLLKIFRLVKYYKYQIGRQYDLSLTTFQYKINISVSSFCLMAHMLACVFYTISMCQPSADASDLCAKNGSDTWTTVFKSENGILDDPKDFVEWKWWVRSLYWVVTVVSTTGFGDIVPHTAQEMGVAIVCIFCGAFILSVILSDFTAGMASITKAHREYMYQVQLLVTHLRNIGLSETRQNQVMMYFLMMWDRSRGISYSKATTILPICLQIDVCNALFGPCLMTIPYFRGDDEESFIRQLSARVIHSTFIPGICIVKEGDQGSSMFVVLNGLVVSTRIPLFDPPEEEPDPNEEVILPPSGQKKKSVNLNVNLDQVYNVGDVFGRFPALFRDECYKKSYRAETRVEVLQISQDSIQFLATKFPYFKRNLKYLIETRYGLNCPGESIFSEAKQKAHNMFDVDEFKTPDQKAAPKQPHHHQNKADEEERHHHHHNENKERLTSVEQDHDKTTTYANILDDVLHGEAGATVRAFKEFRKRGQSVFKDVGQDLRWEKWPRDGVGLSSDNKQQQDLSQSLQAMASPTMQDPSSPTPSKLESFTTSEQQVLKSSKSNKQKRASGSTALPSQTASRRTSVPAQDVGFDPLKKYKEDKKLKQEKQQYRAQGKRYISTTSTMLEPGGGGSRTPSQETTPERSNNK